MNELKNCSILLKRFLKRKIQVTDALVVVFLITGGIGFAENLAPSNFVPPENAVISKLELTTLDPTKAKIQFITEGIEISGDTLIDSDYLGGISSINGKDATNKYTILSEDGTGPHYGMLAVGMGTGEGSYSQVKNLGTIKNTGDFGMAALNGGRAINGGRSAETEETIEDNNTIKENQIYGTIENNGNFGMLAVGAKNSDDSLAKIEGEGESKHTKRTLAVNEMYGKILGTSEGGVQDVGMAAFGNAVALNKGLVKNNGIIGMYAQDGASAVNRGADDKIHDGEEETETPALFADSSTEEEDKIIREEGAGVKNRGDFGMVTYSSTGQLTTAANFGLVANEGDFGVTAINTGAVALNLGWNEDEHETATETTSSDDAGSGNHGSSDSGGVGQGHFKGHGIIKNGGNFGMSALEGGVALNMGRIENALDVGMFASGPLSIVVNSEKSMKGLIPDTAVREELNEQVFVKEFGNYKQGIKPISGIYNGGNFGMVAQNQAIAINDGVIVNGKNVGMLVYDKSLGVNTKNGSVTPLYTDVTGPRAGVYLLGDSAFINNGSINMEITKTIEKDGEEVEVILAPKPVGDNLYAIYAGTGSNAIYLGTNSKINGIVSGEGGTNTLYFIATENNVETSDNHEETTDIETVLPIQKNIADYGNIKAETFAHIGVAAKRSILDDGTVGTGKDIDSTLGGFSGEYDTTGDNGTLAGYTLVVDRVMNMRASSHGKIEAGYDGDSSGYLSFNKFNSFQVEGKEIDDYKNNGRFTGDLIVTGEKDQDGNIIKDGNIILKLAQNRVSTIAANSLNTIASTAVPLIETEEPLPIPTEGKITQKSFDEFFVTDANKIEVKNILLNTSDITEIANKVIKISDTEYKVITGNSEFILAFDNVPTNWNVNVVANADGSISSVYTRIGAGLPGGYGESIDRYTQSNVDIVNAQRITDTGYTYARKAAFLPEEKIVTQESVTLPVKTELVKQGKEMVALPASTPEVAFIDKIDSKKFNNLQFADVFGEKGKYDGNTNSNFDSDTWGVTGASFHRFNENWLSGLSYGYAKSDIDYSKGSEKVDTLGINGLVSYQKQNWLLTGNLGYSWSDHKLNRNAFNNDFLEGDELVTTGENYMNAKFDSRLLTVGGELGYNYIVNSTSSLYPYLGLDYSWYNRDSYKENGGPDLALAIDKTEYSFATSKLGLMYEKKWDKIGFTADLGWRHNFLNNKEDADTYGNFYNKASTAKFRVPGLDIGKDVGYVTLALNYSVSPQFNVGADYTGFTRNNEYGNKFGVNFQYKW